MSSGRGGKQGIDTESPQDEVLVQTEDRVSYVMLFCALLLVRDGKATMEQSMTVVPLFGGAKNLAGELAKRAALQMAPT